MEDHKINEFPRPPEASDWAQDALVPKKPPFSANRREQLLAFGLYVLAYLYLGYQWWALPLFTAGFIAAGFMALLVRIVKNIFQQAIDMKAELDLTI